MNTLRKFISKISGSLYWKISLIFLGLFIILAGVYTYITTSSAEMYFEETSQKLNRSIAQHIASDIKPFIDGEVNQQALENMFHHVMVLNPSIEVYLLDTNGSILSYYAPESKVILDKIALQPVKNFISDTTGRFITGVDPKNPGVEKVFSAARIMEDGNHTGYIYVVLASAEYDSVAQMLEGSYRMRLATNAMLITLISALIIGLIAIWYITRNFNKIITTVKRFKSGDLKARINIESQGELTQVADAFNDMADTIVKNIDELKSVERLRRELIANVSHDLRTPLAAIKGYAETLSMKSDSLTDEQKKNYIEIILTGTEKLKKMVDDLFELSKLEANQIKVNLEPFSLSELVHDVAQKYSLLSKKEGIEIKTKVPKDTPYIYADIALIDRVLQNLMDNAIKYTEAGGSITIELNQSSKGVEVLVSDTGLGIPKDELPFIFERYRKGKKSRKEGVGLGLTIVKKILEIHDSDISVSSQPNKGTTFAFRLTPYPA